MSRYWRSQRLGTQGATVNGSSKWRTQRYSCQVRSRNKGRKEGRGVVLHKVTSGIVLPISCQHIQYLYYIVVTRIYTISLHNTLWYCLNLYMEDSLALQSHSVEVLRVQVIEWIIIHYIVSHQHPYLQSWQ